MFFNEHSYRATKSGIARICDLRTRQLAVQVSSQEAFGLVPRYTSIDILRILNW